MAEEDALAGLKVGVIVRPPDGGALDCLEGFARILQGQGYLVRGLVQRNAPTAQACACTMTLVDIHCGQEYRISQDLGAGSTCCRVDTNAVAEASAVLRQALGAELDLMVVNKFGKLEAQGLGLADEMLSAMAQGIPLLTSVEPQVLDRWRDFTGGIAAELAPTCGSLMRWWEDVRPRGVPRSSRLLRAAQQNAGDGQPFQRIEPIPEMS